MLARTIKQWRGGAFVASAAIVWLSAASASTACEAPSYGPDYFAGPITVQADGSFDSLMPFEMEPIMVDGQGSYFEDNVRGGAVRDLGNGRVGQRLTYGGGCGQTERLLFIECGTAEAILVDGISEQDIAGGSFATIAAIQQPKGPIALRKTTTVAEVAAVALRHGYRHTRDVKAEAAKLPRDKRYDPFSGCRIFYPESAGATG